MKYIQISDSHLFGEAGRRLIGVDTEASLQAVLRLIEQETDVAGVLATGDISQDASPDSYRRFAECLESLDCPLYWLPGNHDDPASFHAAQSGFPLPARQLISAGNWRILLLDSVIPGENSGHLGESEIEYIESNIVDNDYYYLVAMHHHCQPCGAAWLDSMQLDNSKQFVELIKRVPAVRLVINGHIHMETSKVEDGITFLSTPSTCFQFTPGSMEFSLDTQLPGYRRLFLHPDGQFETEVVRLQHYDMQINASVDGY
jgi:Icc protein